MEQSLIKSILDYHREHTYMLSDQIYYDQKLQTNFVCPINYGNKKKEEEENPSVKSIKCEETDQKTPQGLISLQTPVQIRSRSKRQLFVISDDQSKYWDKFAYYSLIKMLFPEVQGLPALGINVIDTIFYNIDNSMTYVYTDPKRGLIKTKSKNYSQLFFRRRNQISLFENFVNNNNSMLSNSSNSRYQETYLKNYNYVALLRYRDQNFIRLKEDQFRSLFIRPVQANQRYKINGFAVYLQMIPENVNYNQNTIFTIDFDLRKHENTQFFNKVSKNHCQETSFVSEEQTKKYKQQLKCDNYQLYLLHTIFQIHSYIHIHYKKLLEQGIFEFMKIGDDYFLSNIRNIKITQNKKIQNFYKSTEILGQNSLQQLCCNFDYDEPTELTQTFQKIFDHQNQKICKKVRTFIDKKIAEIENRDDVQQSQRIFELLNEDCHKNMHHYFSDEKKYTDFIRKKQNKFDRTSPFSTISNIIVSKTKLKSFQSQNTRNKNRKLHSKQNKPINPFFQTQRALRKNNPSKWKLNAQKIK